MPLGIRRGGEAAAERNYDEFGRTIPNGRCSSHSTPRHILGKTVTRASPKQSAKKVTLKAAPLEPHVHPDSMPPEPLYYHQMLRHPHAGGFKQAMKVEIKALQSKNTWKEVPYSSASLVNKTPIPTTWVFKYKFDNQGFLTKYKARLCARGDLQHTTQDTFAATVAARIFRVLMAIVAAFDWETSQYDAVNAFANSEIDEPTYCKVPDGWTGSDQILLLLLRALYGLKQSPALWYKHLSQTLVDLGFEPVAGVECLFTNAFMLLFFFIDDIVVLFDQQYTAQVDNFQTRFFDAYEMRFLEELEWFPGIRISRNRETGQLWLCQDSYIEQNLTFPLRIDVLGPHYRTKNGPRRQLKQRHKRFMLINNVLDRSTSLLLSPVLTLPTLHQSFRNTLQIRRNAILTVLIGYCCTLRTHEIYPSSLTPKRRIFAKYSLRAAMRPLRTIWTLDRALKDTRFCCTMARSIGRRLNRRRSRRVLRRRNY